ncbi:hypothetical protein [Janthinobacterium sp.]|jgi:hypothetical protein|uniref:hypothetical protein n=1 Tax=Janthinobacterium sp. TaxID=1871054 RepID=UPI00289953AD|nr:hypothetical protein [Janthinobacterium sp.]
MSTRQPTRKPVTRTSALARTPWQLCVALFSALALVFLLSTAASHLHKTSLDAEECALCATAIDKVADIAVPPALVEPPAQLLPYRLLAVLPALPAPVITLLLPPVRGPPSTSL